MRRTGTLQTNGESRLDDGTLLARCNEPNPIAAGTACLKNKGLRDRDFIWVTGNDGSVGGVPVFCMDDAGLETGALAARKKVVPKKKPRTRKPTKPKRRKRGRRKGGRTRKGK